MELKGKKIAVLGLGREGLALARFFNQERIDADFLDENSNADDADIVAQGFCTVIKPNAFASLNKYDVIFRSPGISINHPRLLGVRKKLTSLTRMFFELWPGKVIGVTGTKGKGTTASLIKSILNEAGVPSVLMGNIGEVGLTDIAKYNKDAVAVYELSSFQLMELGVSPDIAVVLDVSSEHLDYHKDVNEYRRAKLEIVKHQLSKGWLIITCQNPSFDDFAGASHAQKIGVSLLSNCLEKSVWWHEHTLNQTVSEGGEKVVTDRDIKITGAHNMVNIACATGAALALGIDIAQIIKGITVFTGLPYRLQNIGIFGSVTYYNDSASTNPQTVLAATSAVSGPKHLIIGGRNKGLEYDDMVKKLIRDGNIITIIVYGELRKEMPEVTSIEYNKFVMVENLAQAVEKVVELSKPHDSVIFSPGAASFDQFTNYEVRGQAFNKIVYGLNRN